jgi:hypothetical protein
LLNAVFARLIDMVSLSLNTQIFLRTLCVVMLSAFWLGTARAENDAWSRPLLPDAMTPGLGAASPSANLGDDGTTGGPAVITVRGTNRSISSASSGQAGPAGYGYYIDFRARSALTYGHSFVMFGRLDAKGRQLSREVAGLHPASDNPQVYMLGHLIWVPSDTGPSDGDLEDEYMTAQHRVFLTKDQYDRVVAYIRNLQRSSPMWHAVMYNCSSFVGSIAGFMGFSSPGHLEFPENFVNGIKSLNAGRNIMLDPTAVAGATSEVFR